MTKLCMDRKNYSLTKVLSSIPHQRLEKIYTVKKTILKNTLEELKPI
jgi:hypothetical protein